MEPMKITEMDKIEIVSVNHKPYMYSDFRIDANSLPEGFVKYDVREGDEGEPFAQLRPSVWVNYFGTIIGTDELPLCPVMGDFVPENEEDWWFTGDYVDSPEEFISRYDELAEQCLD